MPSGRKQFVSIPNLTALLAGLTITIINMTMSKNLRFAAGYLIGSAIFIFLLPYGVYSVSKLNFLPAPGILNALYINIVLAAPLFMTGVIFLIWSNVSLLLTGKGGPADALGVSVSPRTMKLVTSGPYRYSRNPMVTGAFCLYLSIAVYQMSVPGILAVIVLFILVIKYIVRSEEKRLRHDFGNEYEAYCKRTPRFFPGPVKGSGK